MLVLNGFDMCRRIADMLNVENRVWMGDLKGNVERFLELQVFPRDNIYIYTPSGNLAKLWKMDHL